MISTPLCSPARVSPSAAIPYDTDFSTLSQEQANLLYQGRFDAVELESVTEERLHSLARG
jgi:hypothetical protein